MKRTAFEAILDSEFRWPQVGDRPFIVAPDPYANAQVAEDRHTRMVLMTEGYKKGADLMVANAEAEPLERHYLVCPIIFNYRQFLELSLKYLVSTYGGTVGVDAIWKSHDLVELWRAFMLVLDRYGSADPDDSDPIVAAIVGEFAKIDPGSYSFRYPVDTKGRPIPLAVPDLHLPTLADVMMAAAGYFTGCDGYLCELQGAGP